MAELTIVVASHHFVVRNITARATEAIVGSPERVGFAQKYVQYGIVRIPVPGRRPILKRGPVRTFATATADRREYRFHINVLPAFEQHLSQHHIKGDMIEWLVREIKSGVAVELPIFSHWSDRDYQEPVIEYLCAPPPPRSKFVDLQTGKGKSFCAMRAIAESGQRAVFLLRPGFIDKWIIDIRKTYDIPIEDVMVVRGGESLMALLEMARTGTMDAKIVLVSNKTFQIWLKLYKELGVATLDMGYACLPEEFFEFVGATWRVIDEVHLDFHLNFLIDLYTHVERSISLSATLLSDDDFVNGMYELAYPLHERYQGPAYDKYVNAQAVMFTLTEPKLVRWKDPATKAYNHHLFEASILRHPQMRENYFRLITQVVRGTWMTPTYQSGEKAIVFCVSIAMCTALVEYLRRQFPGKDIRRYVEDDPYQDLMDADIRVTTVGSAGTGVDIDNLTSCVLTQALASSQGNIQGFGRLRKLKSGKTPIFAYFVCTDIPKHLDYHERKRKLLELRALAYTPKYISQPI